MGAIQIHQLSVEEFMELISSTIKKEIQDGKSKLEHQNHKEFLSRKETAELFGISYVCLHDWINKEVLHPIKIGGKTFFRYQDLKILFEGK